MLKYRRIYAAIAVAFALLSAATVKLAVDHNRIADDTAELSVGENMTGIPDDRVETDSLPLYFIKVIDRKLAVCSGEGELLYKSDIWVFTLPEEEQEQLEDGLYIYDERELADLLDKYTS